MTRIEEPATVLTDWVMAVLAGFWAAELFAAGAARAGSGIATLVWGGAFVATALSAASAGAVHGFRGAMGPAVADPLWRATLHVITLGSACMLAAAILVFPPSPLRTLGLALVAVKLTAATVMLAKEAEFRVALVDHVISLMSVLALQGGAWAAYGAPSTVWITGGIGLSLAGGWIQAREISPHPRFNHNDLYHVVQIGALWLLYRGGLLLDTR